MSGYTQSADRGRDRLVAGHAIHSGRKMIDRAKEAAEYERKGREADALRAAGHGIHGSKVDGRYAHEWFSLAAAVRKHFGVGIESEV